jgi:hypothetical protein
MGAPCARGEAWAKLVMTRCAAAVAVGEGGRGELGELESAGYAIGASPWQSAHSSVELCPGQVRESGRAGRNAHLGISKGKRRGERRATDRDG